MMRTLFAGETLKELVEDYTGGNTKAEALRYLADDTISEIECWLDDLDGDDLLSLIQDNVDDEVHRMEELNDVFRHYEVTEVLEELTEIDLCDEYFHGCDKNSGNDIYEIAGTYQNKVARGLYEGEYQWYDDDFERIMRRSEEIKDAIEQHYAIYEKAKVLFEQQLKEDPYAVITALWSLGMDN